MWLVLGQHHDVEARWVAAELGERADRPVTLVTDATLVHDCRWDVRVGAARARSRLVLGDGTVLDPTTVDAVVNRLSWLGAEAFGGASERDREYATGELHALGLAWLESLGGRVVNRPAGNGLAGPWRRTSEWRTLARTVGLPVVAYDSDDPEAERLTFEPDDRVVLVLDGEVLDAGAGAGSGPGAGLPPAVREGLSALQRAAGLDLLEARLSPRPDGDGDGWALRSASFLPALSRFGDVGLDALHKALIARGGGGR